MCLYGRSVAKLKNYGSTSAHFGGNEEKVIIVIPDVKEDFQFFSPNELELNPSDQSARLIAKFQLESTRFGVVLRNHQTQSVANHEIEWK
jgi:hypothetical protein